MTIHDKKRSLDQIHGKSIELGCGDRKLDRHSVGIDSLDYADVDIVGDVFDVLELIPDSSIRSVYSAHFMEHLGDIERLVGEMGRILMPGGTVHTIVPHFSNPYYFSDSTHKAFFGLYSMSYFSVPGYFRRGVPDYQRNLDFEIEGVDLVFKSARPFYVRHGLKKIWQVLFNLNTYMKEFYEENFAYIIPCYEIHYHLVKRIKISPIGEH